MPKFRKKPVVVDAFHFQEDSMDHERWPEWLRHASMLPEGYPGRILRRADGKVCIATLEGDHVVSVGDWIIKGVKGELYPCKPDIFQQTYDPAD